MFKQIICVAFIAACVSAGPIDFENCGNNDSAEITELRVTDCDALPCTFHKGQNYSVEVDAVSKSNSNALPYTVTAVIIVPITIIEGDACQNLTAGSCPATPGASFTYAAVFNIPTSFPSLGTTVTANVKDDNGNVVICARLRINIANRRDDVLAIEHKPIPTHNQISISKIH